MGEDGGATERIKCIRGERDRNFTTPLSSKAVCVSDLPHLLDVMPRMNSGDWKGKMCLPALVGLSLILRRRPCKSARSRGRLIFRIAKEVHQLSY